MIRFEGVSKSFRVGRGWIRVLDPLDLTLPPGRALALLGRNGAGKSTLLHLIAGNLRPDTGRIHRTGSISWPVGFGGALHPDLTGMQNTRFLARIYGVDTGELCDFVQDFAQIGAHFRMPVRTLSQGMRARLTFGLSMGIAFDTYLVDEITGAGDALFRAKSRALFAARLAHAGAIVVNHNLAELRDTCSAALLLDAGKLTYFEDIDAAFAEHRRLMAA